MGGIVVVDGGGELSDVFAGVVKIEDFNGSGKGQTTVFPNPCGSVAEIDDFLSSIKTTTESFLPEQDGDLAAALVGAGVAGGGRIAQGFSFLIASRLGEDATEFGLAGLCASVWLFAFDFFEFLAAHGVPVPSQLT